MAKIGPLQITERTGVSQPVLLPTTSMTSANVPVQKLSYMDYGTPMANMKASYAVSEELGAMVDKVGQAAIYIDKVKKQHEKVKIGTEFQAFQDEFQRNWASEPTLDGRQKLYDDYTRAIPQMQAGIQARLGSGIEAQQYTAQLGISSKKLSADSFVKLENQRLQETDSLAVLQNKVLAKKFATDPSLDVRTGIQTGTATIQGRIDTGAITEETGAILKTDFVSAALTNRATLMGRLTAKYYANNPTDIPETAAEISAVFQDRMGDIVLSESDSEVALDSFTSTFHKELRLQLSLAKEADAALRDKNKDFIRLMEDEMKEGEDKLTLTREKVEIIANSLDLKGLEEEAGKIRSRGRTYFEKGQVDRDTHMYWTQEGSEGRDLLVSKGFLSKESGYWKENDAKEFVRNSGVTHPTTLNGILRTLRGEDAKRIDDYTTESQINNSMVPYLHKSGIALKYLDPESWNDYTVTQRAEGTYIQTLSNISPDLGRLMSTVKKKVETARLNASNDPKSPFNEKAFANPTKQGQDYDKLIQRLVKETHDEIQASKGKQGEPKVTVKTLEEATAAKDATDKNAVENGQFGSEEAKEEHQENKNIIKKETALLKTPPHQEGAVVKELTAEGEFKTEDELKHDKIMEKSQIVAPLIKLGENIVTLKKRMGTDTPPAMKKYMKQRGEVVEDITDDIGAVFGSAYDAVTKQLGEEFAALGTLFGGGEDEVAPEPQVVSEEGTKVLQDITQQLDALPKDEQEKELRKTYDQIAFDTATELGKETPNQKAIDYYYELMNGLKSQYGDYKLNDPEGWVNTILQNQGGELTGLGRWQPTSEEDIARIQQDSPEQYADYASRFINQVGARMGFAPVEGDQVSPPMQDLATQQEPVVQPTTVTSNAPDWVKAYGNAATDLFDEEGLKNTVYKDVDVKGNLKGHAAGLGHRLTPSELKRWDGKTIPDAQIQAWFKKDYAKYSKAAETQAKQIPNINATLQDALVSVNWQLGTGWNKKFKRAWQHLKDNKWDSAIAEFEYKKEGSSEKSDWNVQTPKRVAAIVSAIRTQMGEQPAQSSEASTSLEPTMVKSARENLFGFDGVRTMKQFKADEQVEVRRVAKMAIERGKKTGNYEFSYSDYDEEGGENLSYQMDEGDIRWTDPAYNTKMTIGEGRVVRHKGKLYVADEVNFVDQKFLKGSDEYTGEKPLDQRSVGERMQFILGEIREKGFSLYGLGHRLNEAFGAGMGKGASLRAELGTRQDFDLSDEEFKKIPTLEDYEKDKLAEGAINPKNVGKVA